jgi:hypothetical protein
MMAEAIALNFSCFVAAFIFNPPVMNSRFCDP